MSTTSNRLSDVITFGLQAVVTFLHDTECGIVFKLSRPLSNEGQGSPFHFVMRGLTIGASIGCPQV